jgi:Ni,Fe-hydrogenase III small subunit
MRYRKKIVKLPRGMVEGSIVGVAGDGDKQYKVLRIVYDANGNVDDVHISTGWAEALCNIYMLRNGNHYQSMLYPENFIYVAIGECDICGSIFPDSCSYFDRGTPSGMVCVSCNRYQNDIYTGRICDENYRET